jgi:hypothetical protein
MVRKQFLLSTATICLMLTSGLVYAQSPADSKKDDTQKERVQKNEPSKSEPAKGAEPRSDVKGQEKSSEHTGAKDQKTPAAAMEKSGASKQDKDRAGNEGAKQHDQAGDSRHGGKDAASDKSASEKSSAEKSASEKSGQDTQKSKSGESKSGAASTDRPQNQNQAGETSKTGPAQSQQTSTPPSSQTNKPAAANEADKTKTTNEAQRGQAGGSSSSTVTSSQTQLSPDKQVRISETLTRTQLAPPERNLNASISIGTELPRGVRLHRLPPDIVSIEPEYRDYEYVTTEEEIVIVDPRSHRIVSTLPKDPARARAQVQGGSNTADMRSGTATTSVAGNTASPCRIMRRDASGQLSEASPTTVGSSAQRPNSLAVIVQTPDQRSTPPIPLDAQAGQIVVATQGQGDCTVTIEPQGAR